MPDTYQQTATNPQTGEKFGFDGSKWVSITAPSATKRLITQTLGVPEDIDTSLSTAKKDISSLGDLDTWITAMKNAVKSLNPYGGIADTQQTARERLNQPGWMNKVTGIEEFLESGVPYAGAPAVRSHEQFGKGDYAGGIGSAINAAILARGTPELAKRTLTGPVRTASQFLTGIGKDTVEQSRKKFGSQVVEEGKQYRSDLDQAKTSTAQEIAKKNESDIARSKAESAVAAKKAVDPSSLRGPVYQHIESIANSVGDDVQNLDTKIRQYQNGKWEQLRETAKDVQVKWPDDAIAKARSQLQTPESASKFDAVLDKVREEADEEPTVRALNDKEVQASKVAGNLLKRGESPASVKSMLTNLGFVPKEVRAIVSSIPELAQSEPSGEGLDFGKARARFTKLGEKIYGGADLPGDVGRGLRSVQDALDGNIKESLPSTAARSFYEKLKGNWRQYMEDFYDPNGPFTKIKNTPTPVDRINALTGKWGKEMLDAMGKYKQFDPQFNLTTRLRTINRAIENLPGSVPKGGTERPSYTAPKEPGVKVFDPVAARKAILEGHVPTGVTPGLFWRYAMLRNLMHKLTNMPNVKDFLSQNPK